MTGSSRITFTNSGVYLIITSYQVYNPPGGGSSSVAYFWLTQNGVNVSASNFYVQINDSRALVVTTNNIVNVSANDYIQLVFYKTDNIYLDAYSFDSSPQIPSVITTINRIG
ncbi:hypothetical protein EBZ80_02505 [bacterium]|nr:hypothetical protein [bacterium]